MSDPLVNIPDMRITQRKGDIATAQAVATFTARGFDVSIPLTESAAYDLIVDDGKELHRVQCKYAGAQRRQVGLRNIHTNAGGYVVKFVQRDAYDWLCILAADGAEYLIQECLHGCNSVNLLPSYRLGAVAESGLSLPIVGGLMGLTSC
jgi:hypothetical protein